jgi:urease accessory protein
VGSTGIRITEEAFLTPPEFAGRGLARPGTGQVGGARLELVEREGKTLLGACYQQVPVRVLPPFHFPDRPESLLYLVVPTVGLMDGDGHGIELSAAVGTRTVVTGQSANRIHPARDGFATQQWQVRIADGAVLVVLPGPTIPFAGCRYYQRSRLDLAGHARLIWGDIWLPGRYARGEQSERFRFEQIVQDLAIHRDTELVYRERFSWQGPWDDETARWHLGNGEAAGSLFVTGAAPRGVEVNTPGTVCAVLPTAHGDTCIRWCGRPAAVIHAVVGAAMIIAGGWTGEDSTPWLLGSSHLGPNHWFSVSSASPSTGRCGVVDDVQIGIR